MELEDPLAATSTAQPSSESTATFGRKRSGSCGNDDVNVPTLTPISKPLGRRNLAVQATPSGSERGRQERKDRSNRSSSFEPSSTPVMIKTINNKSPTTGRSSEGTSKPRRSNRGSVKGSARDSRPGRSNEQGPEATLERFIAEAGAVSTSDPVLMFDGRLRRIDPDAENSCGKRGSSQHTGQIMKTWLGLGKPKNNKMW